MKKILYSTCVTILLSSLISCEKYLDENPDMRTEINSVDKVAKLVTNAYPKRTYLAMAETYSDNVSDKGLEVEAHTNEPYASLYLWEDIPSAGSNTPSIYWNSLYQSIAVANHALAAIEENDFGEEVLPYKGEALIARAYAHFMLVTYFARVYVPDDANDSPGIPYVDEPERVALATYSRGTVASVYERIEKDLTAGITLLQGGKWEVPTYHFTPAATAAFAARFYLFKGEYDKVIEHANRIFPNGDFTGKIRPWNSEFTTYTTAEFLRAITIPSKEFNLLLAEALSTHQFASQSIQSRWGFGTQKYNEIFNAVTAAGTRFYNRDLAIGSGNFTAHKIPTYYIGTSTVAYTTVPLFVSDEALLNRAEAYVRTNQIDQALLDLNYFASQRVRDYNPVSHQVTVQKSKDFFGVTDDAEALIQTILQFKQNAFVGEGLRWLDLIRLKIPVVHNYIRPNGAEEFFTLGPDDLRRVFQIPQDAGIAGIEPNPR